MKKTVSILLSVATALAMLTGCGGTAENGTSAEASVPATAETEEEKAEQVETLDIETAQVTGVGYQVNTELDQSQEITLDIVGPGLFEYGEDGAADLATGLYRPGYGEIAERWNELYPNVKLNFNICPWSDWQSSITTACLDGSADIIMHGATMTDLTEDLEPYLEAEPEYRDQLYALATRRLTETPNVWKVSGISVYTAPIVVWIDKEKFEHFGVELPEDGWTIEEFTEIAASLTGTVPVTGEEVYGVQLPFSGGSNLWVNHMLMAYIYGAEIYQYGDTMQDCTVNYTSEESIQAFQALIDLAQYESPEAKEGGTVSSTLDGNINWAMIATNNPVSDYLLIKTTGLEDRYVAYNLPVIKKGEYEGAPAPYYGDANIAMYKDSDAKEWVWEFIKFMTTDEVATQWVVDQLVYPNNKNAVEAVETLLDERTLEVVKYAMDNMPENFNCATNENFNNVSFGPVTNNTITAVDDVLNGRATAEEAAQFMQDSVNEYLSTIG